MKEYGGYIELDSYRLPMLHEKAIGLNCGRNCLAYILKAKSIKKLLMPYFLCDSVFGVCNKNNVELSFYHIDENFQPVDIELDSDTWLYVVNYYGQLSKDYLLRLKQKYDRIIVDNSQAYFNNPISGIDCFYTCRKFFGVADGGLLYTNVSLGEKLPIDESFDRMRFLLGRYERNASEFYEEYVANNHLFTSEPIKSMSKLTRNLLHGIDYSFVKQRRTENYEFYHEELGNINKLKLREIEGAFCYPLLLENGSLVREKLLQEKIYVPTLWPNVLNDMNQNSLEYNYASNILPLPCDQRYRIDDLRYIIERLRAIISELE